MQSVMLAVSAFKGLARPPLVNNLQARRYALEKPHSANKDWNMKIELTDAITAIRSQLTESITSAADSDVRFRVDKISLEFHVAVERSAEASAGIRFWVLSFGGGAAAQVEDGHAVHVTLTPVMSDGEPVLTRGTS